MKKLKQDSLATKPRHLQTGVIVLLFAFWFLIIPLIIGIILLNAQKKFEQQQQERYKMIDSAEIYSDKIKKESDLLLHNSKAEADFTIKKSGQKAKDIIDKAQRDAQEIMDNAQSKADKTKEKAKADLKKIKDDAKQSITELNNEINDLVNKKNSLQNDITILNQESLEQFTIITIDEQITSEEYKSKYNLLVLEEKELLKSNNAVKSRRTDVNKRIVDSFIKQILRCFNAETSAAISTITIKNIDSIKAKIIKTFEALNKLFADNYVELTKDVLEIKLKEADLLYSYEYQKEQERLQQKAIKEQMIEEEKLRREIEKEKLKVEKEEKQFKNEISKLMSFLQKSSDIEKQLYVDKIKELEEKLKEVEKIKEDVLNREQNTRAGYVYIISNIGSFGENVFKIGMTRRLQPMDRINELGSASVPFDFDVHAMIFSDDAPSLENALHKHFDKNKVNKVNSRKEFFRVSLEEIEKVVKENYNGTVEFTMIAEAYQYRESLRLSNI